VSAAVTPSSAPSAPGELAVDALAALGFYDRDDAEILDNVLTPPAAVNGKLFVGTILGEVCCLAAGSGEVLWRDALDEPVIFQPAVVGGRVYAATGAGSLFGIETGDPRDDGWPM
jgi:outer membrane protein assembly factor BamB